MEINKKILVAPLNWGLGHAVRDIPLINELLKNKFEVILAGEGKSGELLKKEFPDLHFISLTSFSVTYPKNNLFVLKLLLQLPKFIRGIHKEHKQIQEIVEKYKIDIIISDNRYGLYSDKVPSIFITHQVFPVLPKSLKIFEKIIHNMHLKRINKFNKCLIPDFEGTINLTGELSHKSIYSEKFNFIGILSQFEYKEINQENYKYDIAVILSGPEPQRSIFEKLITKEVIKTGKKAIIITGQPGLNNEENKKDKNLVIVNHLSRNEMQDIILNSRVIISRAGYTTVMDLVKLRKKAILIPTPGQTEQEYLTEYLKDKKMFVFRNQNRLDLNNALNELELLKPEFKKYSDLNNYCFINIIKSLI